MRIGRYERRCKITGRELHHRKKDNKYALWSTVVDDYITDWEDKEYIRRYWHLEECNKAKEKVDQWIEQIDKEV